MPNGSRRERGEVNTLVKELLTMHRVWLFVVVVLSGVCAACLLRGTDASAAEKVPIVYSTDLFHPHADPDDHYDLACLFALEEFDIRGIILDLGGRSRPSGRAGRRSSR